MPKRSFPFDETPRLQLKTHIYVSHIEKEEIYGKEYTVFVYLDYCCGFHPS